MPLRGEIIEYLREVELAEEKIRGREHGIIHYLGLAILGTILILLVLYWVYCLPLTLREKVILLGIIIFALLFILDRFFCVYRGYLFFDAKPSGWHKYL